MASKIESGKLLLKRKKISNKIKAFSETFFKQNSSKTNVKKQEFLTLNTKTLPDQQSDLCENEIRETDLFDSMKSMENNKTTGNDGLTK